MPRFMRRRSGFRKNWVSRQEHFWAVANTANFTVAAGTILDAALVAPSDFAVRAGLEKATVVRMRGWFAARNTSSNSSAWYLIVVVREAGSAALDPSLTASLRDYDVLYTAGGIISRPAVGDDSQVAYIPAFDIPVKRRLTENQEINLYMRCDAGTACTVSYAIRSLVVIK